LTLPVFLFFEEKERNKTMKVYNSQFVLCSDLFDGLDNLLYEFCNSSPPFSWGDNNRTLVTAKAIIDHLDGSAVENATELETLRGRVNSVGLQMLVDLEN
jgi:hypothetical protein